MCTNKVICKECKYFHDDSDEYYVLLCSHPSIATRFQKQSVTGTTPTSRYPKCFTINKGGDCSKFERVGWIKLFFRKFKRYPSYAQ